MRLIKIKKKRKGRHSKNMSKNKNSKNYKKPYVKQGR